MADRTDVLILGGGACAQQIAEKLAHLNVSVSLVCPGPAEPDDHLSRFRSDLIQWLPHTRLVQCSGCAGNFQIKLQHNGRFIARQAAAIIVAEDQPLHPEYESYGLVPGERIRTVDGMQTGLARQENRTSGNGKVQVVLLNGWQNPSHPSVTRGMLQLCLDLQNYPMVQTFYLTGDLKVGAHGLEDLYQKAKSQGTVFLKFDRDFPVVRMLPDGRAQFDCPDETAGLRLQITADWTVVDEIVQPSEILEALGADLVLEIDREGFLQADNVHRLINQTNRRGIFAAGSSRDRMTVPALQDDAENAAYSVAEFLWNRDRGADVQVEIQPGRCARCLTCYRLCPYRAIAIESHMTIHHEACQACGICVAACPARAIEMDQWDVDASLSRAFQNRHEEPVDASSVLPRRAVFCCTRSAGQARLAALADDPSLGENLVFIEGMCSGSFSSRHLLSAFEAGMEAVLVLTCHEGNCHSGSGRQRAVKNVTAARKALEQARIDPDRLQLNSVAANMPGQLTTMIRTFKERMGQKT